MGGMGVLCKGIVDNLPNNDFNINVVGGDQCKTSYRWGKYIPSNHIVIYTGEPDPLIHHMFNQMSYVDCVKEPDIIHCFDWSTFGAGMYLKQKYNCKLICSVQLAIDDIVEHTKVHSHQRTAYDSAKAIEIQGLLTSDVVVQVSQHYARKFPMFFNKTLVINNGVDLEEFKTKDKINLPGDQNNLKLLYIGRYADMKNTHVLSSIQLPEGVSLYFAGNDKGGDTNVWNLTQAYIDSNPQMFYIGPYYGKDKIKLFNSVDGVVFPSLREPFGIAGIEALAAGKILLASNVDGMKDYLNNKNHINCGVTKESIESAILKFKMLNKEERDIFKQEGLKTVENFSWIKQSLTYYKLYKMLKD